MRAGAGRRLVGGGGGRPRSGPRHRSLGVVGSWRWIRFVVFFLISFFLSWVRLGRLGRLVGGSGFFVAVKGVWRGGSGVFTMELVP